MQCKMLLLYRYCLFICHAPWWWRGVVGMMSRLCRARVGTMSRLCRARLSSSLCVLACSTGDLTRKNAGRVLKKMRQTVIHRPFAVFERRTGDLAKKKGGKSFKKMRQTVIHRPLAFVPINTSWKGQCLEIFDFLMNIVKHMKNSQVHSGKDMHLCCSGKTI